MKKILALLLSISSLWAASVTFKGEEVTLNSNGLKIGMDAPVFTAVDKDFMEVTVGGKSDKVQVIAFIPSFDSDICKRETIVFNQKVSKMKNVNLMVISKDLPLRSEGSFMIIKSKISLLYLIIRMPIMYLDMVQLSLHQDFWKAFLEELCMLLIAMEK